jgi:hypothetical protein
LAQLAPHVRTWLIRKWRVRFPARRPFCIKTSGIKPGQRGIYIPLRRVVSTQAASLTNSIPPGFDSRVRIYYEGVPAIGAGRDIQASYTISKAPRPMVGYSHCNIVRVYHPVLVLVADPVSSLPLRCISRLACRRGNGIM